MSTARSPWRPAPPWCSSKGTQSEVHRWILADQARAGPAVRGRSRRHPSRRRSRHDDGVRADRGDPRPRRHSQPGDADGDLLGADSGSGQGARRAACGSSSPRTGLRDLRRGRIPPDDRARRRGRCARVGAASGARLARRGPGRVEFESHGKPITASLPRSVGHFTGTSGKNGTTGTPGTAGTAAGGTQPTWMHQQLTIEPGERVYGSASASARSSRTARSSTRGTRTAARRASRPTRTSRST